MDSFDIKTRLDDLHSRIDQMTSSVNFRSLWVHWRDVQTIRDARDLIESLERKLAAIGLDTLNEKKDN
jgi:hypothetical protein